MYFTLQPVKMPQSVSTESREARGLEHRTGLGLDGCFRREYHGEQGGAPGGVGPASDGSPRCSSSPPEVPQVKQQADHHRDRPPAYSDGDRPRACSCAGCGGRIQDRYYLLAADRQWHTECLRCCECGAALDDELTCFAKDGGIYCRDHYFRRFGVTKCAGCGAGIAAHEMVMRARSLVHHLACFACFACSASLSTGDFYGMRDGRVYCQLHYREGGPEQRLRHLPAQPQPHRAPPSQAGLGPGYQGPLTPGPSPPCAPAVPVAFYNGMAGVGVHKGRPRKRKGVDSVGDYCRGLGSVDGHLGLDGDGYVTQQSQRTKRMRTSFKHHQLRTMKTYFGLNHNPDAKDLKQLAQKTGLTKRVLQVWFQNARAKYRRSLLKKEQGGGGGGADKPAGSPSGDLPRGNSVSSPSTNGRSSPTSTTGTASTGGAPSLHGGCDLMDTGSSGSEQGSVILGSLVMDDEEEEEEEEEEEDDDASPGSYGDGDSEGQLSYSELKNASAMSPTLADDVLTVSAMPTRSPNHTLAGDCSLASPGALLSSSVLKTNLVGLFN